MKHFLHRLIAWYVWRCGCAFHLNAYGEDGRYVVLMNERQYNDYTRAVQDEGDAVRTRIARAELAKTAAQ